MKATELRIGNIVRLKIAGDGVFPDEIRPIKASEFYALSEHPDWANPINLTEEWLLKFKFRKLKLNDSYWFEKSHKNIRFITNDINAVKGEAYSTKLKHVFVDMEAEIRVRYVHQLQNLFFSLTGKELTA